MHESLRFVGKVPDGTISRIADRLFLSVTVEIPDPPGIHAQNARTFRRENQTVESVANAETPQSTPPTAWFSR
jgi:hypothetical protein